MDSSTAQIGPRAGDALQASIGSATRAMLGLRRPDGHWVFELEADCTIPAEYVLLRHFLGEPVDAALEAKIANYLRRVQGAHGGWPLVHEGDFDMSASVKAYFALKMIGDSMDAPHMVRAGASGGDHAAAALVAVSYRQDFLLGAHHHGAADGARGAKAARAQPEGRWR
jgi:squalene-hopene/tetraprenyl-beta-curcumene cyclase